MDQTQQRMRRLRHRIQRAIADQYRGPVRIIKRRYVELPSQYSGNANVEIRHIQKVKHGGFNA